MALDSLILFLEILSAIGIGFYYSDKLLDDFTYLAKLLTLVPIFLFGFLMILLISNPNFIDLFVENFIKLIEGVVYSEITGVFSALLKNVIVNIFKLFQ